MLGIVGLTVAGQALGFRDSGRGFAFLGFVGFIGVNGLGFLEPRHALSPPKKVKGLQFRDSESLLQKGWRGQGSGLRGAGFGAWVCCKIKVPLKGFKVLFWEMLEYFGFQDFKNWGSLLGSLQ